MIKRKPVKVILEKDAKYPTYRKFWRWANRAAWEERVWERPFKTDIWSWIAICISILLAGVISICIFYLLPKYLNFKSPVRSTKGIGVLCVFISILILKPVIKLIARIRQKHIDQSIIREKESEEVER